MITQFKIFEKYGETRYYWIVPVDDPIKFEIALEKIGIKEIDIWMDILSYEDVQNVDKIIILKVIDSDEHISREYYDWKEKFEPKKDDVFMGEIEVKNWEVNAKKYNL